MFGEKPIVGQTILRISKDRIILPSFTHAEPGDEVSATLDPYQKKIILLLFFYTLLVKLHFDIHYLDLRSFLD